MHKNKPNRMCARSMQNLCVPNYKILMREIKCGFMSASYGEISKINFSKLGILKMEPENLYVQVILLQTSLHSDISVTSLN